MCVRAGNQASVSHNEATTTVIPADTSNSATYPRRAASESSAPASLRTSSSDFICAVMSGLL